MIKQSEARMMIRSEWSRWRKDHPEITDPNGNDAFVFYNGLDNDNAPALQFRDRGDRWQTVHGWLLEMGLVKD